MMFRPSTKPTGNLRKGLEDIGSILSVVISSLGMDPVLATIDDKLDKVTKDFVLFKKENVKRDADLGYVIYNLILANDLCKTMMSKM